MRSALILSGILAIFGFATVGVSQTTDESLPETVQRLTGELDSLKSVTITRWQLDSVARSWRSEVSNVLSNYGSELNYYRKSSLIIVDTTFGKGEVVFLNNTGFEAVHINAGESESQALVFNPSDEGAAILASGSEGSGVWFAGRSGQPRTGIGCDQNDVGSVSVSGEKVHDYADVFEFATREGVIPGTVVSASDNGQGLVPSNAPYDPKVVGVVSGAGGFSPGMQIGSRTDETNDLPIAVSGQVYVRVCVEEGGIKVGDLLVASSTPGVAMAAADRARAFGAVVGKALESYDPDSGNSEGLIRMLVMNR